MASNQNPNTDFIVKERIDIIQALAMKSKKNPYFENPSSEEAILLHRLDLLLTRLNDEVHMTPDFRDKTKISEGMKLVYDKPAQYKFPQEYVERAKALNEKWESANRGTPVVSKKEDAAESESDSEVTSDSSNNKKRKKKQSSGSDSKESKYLSLPHPAHAIWGIEGIMHGICRARSKDGRTNQQLDSRYNKRPANVYGNNQLQVGAWFPFQLVALFKGAHGSSQAGIYGKETTGAYSVVVSGVYDDVDRDNRDFVYYSGSKSHDNDYPKSPAPSSAGTLALHTSLEAQNPIRVLRSSSGKSKWAPKVGYRYDGLYKVESVAYPLNAKGGMFEQFKLVRVEGQESINTFIPSPREQRQFEKIGDGF